MDFCARLRRHTLPGLLTAPQFVHRVDIPETEVCSLNPFTAGTASHSSRLPSAWHTAGAQYMWVELNLRPVSFHPPVPSPPPTFKGGRGWTACSFPGEPLIIPAVTAMQASTPLMLWSGKHRPLTFAQYSLAQVRLGFPWSRGAEWVRVSLRAPQTRVQSCPALSDHALCPARSLPWSVLRFPCP